MNSEDYLEIGRFIWREYVPKNGQAATVQGELLRASEKLRDECHRNGNANWDSGHEILAKFILDTLTTSDSVPGHAKDQLTRDIERVMDYEHPYSEDDLFDRIERVIFDWYLLNKEPIPRSPNPALRR